MLKIVSWNVNSVKMRLTAVLDFLQRYNPDVLLLQEIKCETVKFPELELQGLGYNTAIYGQKTFNGVAILSKSPIEDIKIGLPGLADEQARYIECFTYIKGIGLRLASVYVPNGQEVGSDKFIYKMKFFDNLYTHLASLLQHEEAVVIGGDFNVAPEEIDVYDAKALEGKIGFHIEERQAFRKILNLGFYDSLRVKHPDLHEYSWWDYRSNALSSNRGMRIDQLLISPEATDKIIGAGVYKEIRQMEKASDHAPIYLDLGTIMN